MTENQRFRMNLRKKFENVLKLIQSRKSTTISVPHKILTDCLTDSLA